MTYIEKALSQAIASTTQCDNKGMSATCTLPKECKAFDGHFESHPILPAVVQILLGRLVSSLFVSKKLICTHVDKAKFMKEIPPETEIEVQVVPKEIPTNTELLDSTIKIEYKFSITLFVTNETKEKVSTFILYCAEDTKNTTGTE